MIKKIKLKQLIQQQKEDEMTFLKEKELTEIKKDKERQKIFDKINYNANKFILKNAEEIVAKNKRKDANFKIPDILQPFNKVYSLDEVRHQCKNELKKEVLDDITKIIKNDNNIFGTPISDIVTIDGLRIIFPDGFALIRQSNTEPVFTLRFEANTEQKCNLYKETLINLTLKLEEECLAQKV